jgi:hypothetical protein
MEEIVNASGRGGGQRTFPRKRTPILQAPTPGYSISLKVSLFYIITLPFHRIYYCRYAIAKVSEYSSITPLFFLQLAIVKTAPSYDNDYIMRGTRARLLFDTNLLRPIYRFFAIGLFGRETTSWPPLPPWGRWGWGTPTLV